MKRIWFVQQKPLEYVPLRVRLGLLPSRLLTDAEYHINHGIIVPPDKKGKQELCPKIYTTRTHPLSGEYYVVEGSRFKAEPVEPRIEFKVRISEELDLRRAVFKKDNAICGWAIADRNSLTFPELDLGFRGATFDMLRDELLRLNPKTTIDTPFYVSMLEPIKKEE